MVEGQTGEGQLFLKILCWEGSYMTSVHIPWGHASMPGMLGNVISAGQLLFFFFFKPSNPHYRRGSKILGGQLAVSTTVSEKRLHEWFRETWAWMYSFTRRVPGLLMGSCPLFFDCQRRCCCSVTQLCPTLCEPMDCSMPGFSVLHHLPEFAQIKAYQQACPSFALITDNPQFVVAEFLSLFLSSSPLLLPASFTLLLHSLFFPFFSFLFLLLFFLLLFLWPQGRVEKGLQG